MRSDVTVHPKCTKWIHTVGFRRFTLFFLEKEAFDLSVAGSVSRVYSLLRFGKVETCGNCSCFSILGSRFLQGDVKRAKENLLIFQIILYLEGIQGRLKLNLGIKKILVMIPVFQEFIKVLGPRSLLLPITKREFSYTIEVGQGSIIYTWQKSISQLSTILLPHPKLV